jgi:hypothetical protein
MPSAIVVFAIPRRVGIAAVGRGDHDDVAGQNALVAGVVD